MKQFSIPFFIFSLCFSLAAHAGFNPFKKDRTLDFGADLPWSTGEQGVTKSGSDRMRGDDYYYHLSIDKHRLLLRLGKNEPVADRKGTWPLEEMSILDLSVDGMTLPQFQWCLENRVNPVSFPVLNMDTATRDGVCKVDIHGADFSIKLNDDSLARIRQARKLTFVLKTGKFLTNLNYDMKGYDVAYADYEAKLASAAAARKKAAMKAKAAAPRKTKVAAKPRPKKCTIRPPAAYAAKVKSHTYLCGDKAAESRARKSINSQIALVKKQDKEAEIKRQKVLEAQRKAELERQRQEETERQAQLERESKWNKIGSFSWLDRCKQKWAVGENPCYCKSYVDEHAPAGISGTVCRN